MTVFRTPREAFAWLANATRGPGAAKVSLEPRVQETRHFDDETVMRMLQLVYGEPPIGCGLRRGSKLEVDLGHWALRKEPAPSKRVAAFARRLDYRLKKHGLKRHNPARPTVRVDMDEDSGTPRRSAHIDETRPTERQADCLEAVIEYQRENGIAPSIREITELMGLSHLSINMAREHLLALERKGWLKLVRRDGQCVPRGIVVLSDGFSGTPKTSWS